jgi:hypothetical protein
MDFIDLVGELNFNWKYKNYELRACPPSLVKLNSEDKNTTIDFVKWSGPITDENRCCVSIAYFVKTNDGYDLKFVGNRPFEHIESEDLPLCWDALKMASNLLNSWQNLYRLI